MAEPSGIIQVRDEAEKKFYGHKVRYGVGELQVPPSVDREYIRAVDDYMKVYKTCIEKMVPQFKKHYQAYLDGIAQQQKEMHLDAEDSESFYNWFSREFDKIQDKVMKNMVRFDLKKRLMKIAYIAENASLKDWKKMVHDTLGIDIMDDYYRGEFFNQTLDSWVDENVDLIVTIPKDNLGKMKEMIYENWSQGLNTRDMGKKIEGQYGIAAWHAKFIARDQCAKLNAKITQKEQEDAGVDAYIWQTCEDQRVRESHKLLNGTVHRWDDPPETDGGRHCHPGEDYQCRCVARPIFDLDKLSFTGGLGSSALM